MSDELYTYEKMLGTILNIVKNNKSYSEEFKTLFNKIYTIFLKYETQSMTKFIERQKKFDIVVQNDERFAKLDKRHKMNALCNFMISEVDEAKKVLGFLHNDQDKWWKNRDQDNTDYEHFIEETIDIFHVLLSIWNILGLNGDDVLLAYEKKNKTNFQRQENNY